jgi:MFS family permease
LILLTAATRSFDNPARQALVPTLVPTEHINSAVNLLLAVRHTGAILGPALGGLLIAAVGVAAAYWINAASFLALIAALLAMRIAAVIGRSRPRVSPGMLAEGMRFIWGAPVVLSLLAIDFMNTGFGTTRSAWPTFARDVFDAGAQGLGLLGSATSIGAILGLGAALILGDVRRKGLGVVLCSLGFGVSVLCFAFSPTLLFAGIGLAGVGFADAVNDSMSHTMLLTVTPDELRGRVNSVAIMLTQGGPSLGQLWVGFLVSALGPREGVAIGGVAVVVFALSLLLFARPLTRYRSTAAPVTA